MNIWVKTVFSDLDWTVLENWILPKNTQETIQNMWKKWISFVPSTWKGFPRMHDMFKNWISILESWARITYPDKSQELNSIENDNLLDLISLANNISDKINFMFFYPKNINLRHAIFFTWENKHPKLNKFDWIRNKYFDFAIWDFENYAKWLWNITMLNLHVNAQSLEELWLNEKYNWLNLVFNEWMLNISVTDKWKAIEKIIYDSRWKMREILVAWNDTNDIPAFDTAVNLVKNQSIEKVWIIIVWWYKYDILESWNITLMEVDSPDKIWEAFRDYYKL